MPFMIGSHPIRRTLPYLQSGKIIFRENVRIFSLNYNTHGDHHQGAREFLFWHMPQIQYKNPNVQCISFKNMTPSPFIQIYFDDAKKILIDIDSRPKDDILKHLNQFAAVCKTKGELKHEEILQEKKDNPANFGYGCEKHCMCEVMGQVPCPGIIYLPNHMRGKYKFATD